MLFSAVAEFCGLMPKVTSTGYKLRKLPDLFSPCDEDESELTPQHVLTGLFNSDDFPVPIPALEAAAEMVIQRLIDAGFEITAQERARS
jgi:hypothetical protein